MANLVLPSKYAQAVFLIAREKNILEQTKEELNILKEILNKNILLKKIIFHPGISKEEKKKIVVNLFSAYVSGFVVNFLKLLIDKKRERLIDDIIDIFSEKVDEYKGIKKVVVETAYPLADNTKEKLLKKLKRIMNSEIVLKTLTREDMLGGIIIRDKLHLIDASVNQFLNSMRNKLIETRVANYKRKIKKTIKKKTVKLKHRKIKKSKRK